MATCAVFPPWPTSQPCSLHGTCIATNTCQCDAAWTSVGDFTVIPNLDCDLNILAIRILWILPLLGSCMLIALSARFLYSYHMARMDMFRENSESGLSKAKLPAWSDVKVLLVLVALLCAFSLLIWSSLRVSDPTGSAYVVGKSGLATALLSIVFLAFWATESLYLYIFTELCVKQARIKASSTREKFRAQFALMKRLLLGLYSLNFIWAFIPFGILMTPTQQYGYSAAHYIGAATNIMITAFYIMPRTLVPIRNDILEALKVQGGGAGGAQSPVSSSSHSGTSSASPSAGATSESERKKATTKAMDDAQKKIGFTYKQVSQAAIQETIVALCFGLWPFIQRKASYQLPITWFIATLAMSLEIGILSSGRKRQEKAKGGAVQRVVASVDTDESSSNTARAGNNRDLTTTQQLSVRGLQSITVDDNSTSHAD